MNHFPEDARDSEHLPLHDERAPGFRHVGEAAQSVLDAIKPPEPDA